MQKYFYPIFKLPTFYERDYVKEELPLWVKWWLLGKAGRELSEILTGSEFTLLHTLNKKFKILNIKGQTSQAHLKGNNLFNINWFVARTHNGITATIEDDHLVLNGTATSTSYIDFSLPSGIYEGSIVWKIKADVASLVYHIVVGSSAINITTVANSWVPSTFNSDTATGGYIEIASGTVLNNCKVYLFNQVTGETLDYEPYCGRNT